MSEPLISVVIPAYNCAGVIGRAIDSALAQNLQPHDIVLMAVIVVHGEFPGYIRQDEHGGAVDAIMLQQFPIGDLLLHRDDLAGEFPLRGHQFPGGAAQNTAGLLYQRKLPDKFIFRPVVIGIQKRHIFAPGQGYAPVPGGGGA